MKKLYQNPNFNFYSNDEIILGIKDGKVIILPFPNEVLIRQITLDTIFRDKKLGFEEWTETNNETGSVTRTTSPVGLYRAGIIAGTPRRVSKWVFLNMESTTKGNSVRKLEDEEALKMFRQSVFLSKNETNVQNTNWPIRTRSTIRKGC